MKNEWMSETTRKKSLNKLDNMILNVAYPDKWYNEWLPDFTNTRCFVDDLKVLNESNIRGIKGLIDKTREANSFEFLFFGNETISLSEVNACYCPEINSINMFPAFLFEPFYDENNSDAINYASFMIIAHEMTHGFDSYGSYFDEVGNVNDLWTVADRMEFERRQELLIDCYNHLEVGQYDNDILYCDGKKTLGENIADLGGFVIAHQYYLKKLKEDGFYGENLLNQERRFYQAYANLWKYKCSINMLYFYRYNDEHATSKERVNGVVMNTDRWYELFNVKFGDKLYLKPEKRTLIW